jgi:protein associated with RNAse G/E
VYTGCPKIRGTTQYVNVNSCWKIMIKIIKKIQYPLDWKIYRCLKIREFRIQGVVVKGPVEFEKYLALPEVFISTSILFNT